MNMVRRYLTIGALLSVLMAGGQSFATPPADAPSPLPAARGEATSDSGSGTMSPDAIATPADGAKKSAITAPLGNSTNASLPPEKAIASPPPRSTTAEQFGGKTPSLFRRVLVPEKELADWPRGNLRYLPVEAEQFERLVEQQRRSAAPEPPEAAARVIEATYSAKLLDDELVGGRGMLRVQSAADGSVILPLGRSRLAIESPRWAAAANKGTTPKGDNPNVVLGTDPEGALAMRVDGSGTLSFSWSLRGQREAGGGLVFSLQLPHCATNHLRLALPAELAPAIDQAVVSEAPLEDRGDGSAPGASPATTSPLLREWQIEMGGQTRAVLRIVRREVASGRRPLTLARQSLTYDFSERGLQVSADLKLDVLRDPISEVALDLDWPLTLVTARYGDMQLSWTEDSQQPDENDLVHLAIARVQTILHDLSVPIPTVSRRRRIVLHLPDPLRGTSRLLRLGAVAPLPTSGRLPSIRPATDDIVWHEGSATLLVPLPLELSELRMTGCRQIKQESLAAPADGEALTLQCFRADADIFVGIRRQVERVQVRSGTSIDIRGATINGRLNAELTSLQGESYSLSADVPSSWIVDSVESAPVSGVASWSVDPPRAGQQRLRITLGRALHKDRPLRLAVAGRWRRPPLGETLEPADLTMVRFRDLDVQRQLVVVRPASGYRLNWSGAEGITRLALDHLDAADASLFEGVTNGRLFVADTRAANLAVTIAKELPQYDGEISLRIDVADETLTETYSLSCSPQTAEMDRLLVHLTTTTGDSLHWVFREDEPATGSAGAVTARKLSLAAAAPALGLAGGEIWELSWQQPRSEPFTLRATRTLPLTSTTPIALASFVEAENQQGTVEIKASGRHLPEVVNRRLKPSALPPGRGDRWPDIVAAYAYSPADEALLAGGDNLPGLMIGPGKSQADAWVWSSAVDVHASADGRLEAIGCWRIENWGRRSLTVQMPAKASIYAAGIDGEPAASSALRPSPTQLRFELPAGKRFVTLVAEWEMKDQPIAIASTRTLETPTLLDLPVLARRVNLWLPPNYRLTGANDSRFDDDDLTWRQRIFGPIGPAAGQAPFNPLAVQDWRKLATSIMPGNRDSEYARQILSQVASAGAAEQDRTSEPLTWGRLLSRVQGQTASDAGNQPPLSLLIDDQALGDVGISADTLCGPSASDPRTPSLSADTADLTILAAPGALLLSTKSAAAGLECAGAVSSTNCLTASSRLAERLLEATLGGDSRFVPVEFWALAKPRSPWPANPNRASIDHAGWISYRLNQADGGPLQVSLVRRDAMLGLGCAAFLTMAVLVVLKGEPTLRMQLPPAIAGILLAFLVPAPYAPIGAGVCLGMACGWGLRWLAGRTLKPAAGGRDGTSMPPVVKQFGSSLVRGGSLLVMLSLPFIAEPRGLAADAAAPAGSQHPTVYDVLVPTDAEQHRSGRDVLVPEPLYEELTRRHSVSPDSTGSWLIESANYQGSIKGTNEPESDWTAHFELETFAATTSVEIPFGGGGATLVPDGLRLDSAVVPFEWRNSGHSIAVQVNKPGRHEMTLSFRPVVGVKNSIQIADFPVPLAANSRLELTSAPGIHVELPTAVGHLARDPTGRRLIAALGPTDRLTVRWGAAAAFDSGPTLADADELLWLKIRPGSVLLEARFTLHVAEGRLRQVELLADQRLRRLPLEGGSPVAQARSGADGSGALYLGLARPISDEVSFKLSFVLTDTSAVGNLQLPKLDVVGVRRIKRRLAISVESPLEADEKSLNGIKPLSVAEFVSNWGTADVKPLMAFELSEKDRPARIAVSSREPALAAEQMSVVSLEQRQTKVSGIIDLSVHDGPIFQVQVATPHSFEVEEVGLVEATGDVQPLRWSRRQSGGMTVFLPGPSTDDYRLLIRGKQPLQFGGRTNLPDVKIEHCKVESETVLVLRKPDISAIVADRGGLAERAAKELPAILDRAVADGLIDRGSLGADRVVAGLTGAPQRPLAVRASLNAPRIEGTEMITMRRDADQWSAVVDLDLKTSGGTLDTLRFELPPQWDAPFQIEPPMTSELIDVPGETHKQLVIHAPEPIAGDQHVRLTAPVRPAAGQRLRAPDIRPLGMSLRRFVRLPTNSNGQQLSWRPQGLKFEPLPRGFPAHLPSAEVYLTCQVIGETFEAALKSVEKETATPRVRLTDIRLSLDNRATGFGTAGFDIEPGDANSCLLDVPPEYRLIHVQVNGGPAIVSEVIANRWSVSLSAGKLPQRLDILFLVERPSSRPADDLSFAAPSLIGFSVEQTVWSINGAPVQSSGEESKVAAISRLDNRLIEMRSAASMLESSASLISGQSQERIDQLFSDDARRLAAARDAYEVERRLSKPPADGSTAAEIRAIDESLKNLAAKLGTQKILAELLAQPSASAAPGDLWRAVSSDYRPTSYFLAAGPSGPIAVAPAAEAASWVGRLFDGLLVAGAVSGLLWLACQKPVREAIGRWPEAIGVGAGLAWWLLLAPSALGLLIVAISLATLSARRRRRLTVSSPDGRAAAAGATTMAVGPDGSFVQ